MVQQFLVLRQRLTSHVLKEVFEDRGYRDMKRIRQT
jgi:hypothetical protein